MKRLSDINVTSPKDIKLKKWINSLILGAITLIVYCIYVAIAASLLNLLINYFFKIIAMLPTIVNNKPAQDMNFKMQYLFSANGHMPGYIILMLAVLMMSTFGRKLVLSSAQKIYSLLPFEITKSTTDGDSRWANSKEIEKEFCKVPKTELHPPYCGMLLATDKQNNYIEKENVHTFCVGTTASGKSQTAVMPSLHTIISCKNPESFITTDIKGEIFENTYKSIEANSFKYYVLNLREPSRSSQWNPLMPIINAYITAKEDNTNDYSKAVELANELAAVITDNPKSDPVWPQSAKSLLVAMIMFLVEDGYNRKCLDKLNLYSVYNFFVEFGGKEYKLGKITVNALDQIMSNLPIGHPAKMAYATSKFAVGEMRSSIFATLASNLQIFADSGIAYLTGGNDIDFCKLAKGNRPFGIYLILPEGKTTRYMLATLFISQCYAELVETADSCPHRILPRRVHFMLDELGIFPKIPDLEKKVPAGRSMGVIFDLFVQSMEQLEDTYGKGAASTIQNNCGNWVYINSLSVDTNKYFSETLGNGTLQYATYSGDNGSLIDRTRMQHSKAKPLLSPDALPKMSMGDAIIIKQRSQPIYTTLTPYYEMGHPMADINEVLKVKEINLDNLLYPIDKITAPGLSANKKPEEVKANNKKVTQEKEIKEAQKIHGIINNMNILTGMRFSNALKKKDYDAVWDMADKAVEEEHISHDAIEILQMYLSKIQN